MDPVIRIGKASPKSAAGIAAWWKKQSSVTRAALLAGVPGVALLAFLSSRRSGATGSLPIDNGNGDASVFLASISDQLLGIDEQLQVLTDENRDENTPSPTTTPPPPPVLAPIHGDPDRSIQPFPRWPGEPFPPMPTTPPPPKNPEPTTPRPPDPPQFKRYEVPEYVQRDIANGGALGEHAQQRAENAINTAERRGVAVPDWLRGQIERGKLGAAGTKRMQQILGRLAGS